MRFKKAASVLAAGMIAAVSATALAGCSDKDKLAGQMFDFGDDYYKSVSERFTLNYDEMLYDDFTNGIDL